ncbi:ATP-dependent metallopeptidase FtsH/Yme1/Tma family protein [Phytoactinopolyspora alkaliphila]|uniref:ATP-dependent zinc metalloprotease FtsH n=1 Tax=Phytoactinopolyspora alkaliphila TaxID=1783498 RepID=A0A6N9YMB8_9ACTN|nr:ATP-dependent zinc metalloprotease FtsH [Phytoactinopolyspora alkaliphila]NED95999.1 ATP-dependent metallopeptidase FtsH/Yme1/Tma family protein [Phytoactinopolyspora alkaliphila]
MNAKRFIRPAIWFVMFVFVALMLNSFLSSGDDPEQVDTAQAIQEIDDGNVKSALITGGDVQRIELTLNNDDEIWAYYVEGQGLDLQNELQRQNEAGNLAEGYDVDIPQSNPWMAVLGTVLPLLLLVALIIFFLSRVQGGGGRVMQFGKNRAKLASKDAPKTTFSDVAGANEAIEELQEIKEFLQEPGKFQAVGAKIPKGVLLYGPPGTGKTLLARAVAGEAGVPFYSISGSDFVEMFVGVGASRVRDLFKEAKENAPAIVFVDEIDAVGRHRGAGMGGGHDEREQTLNQLLVEMDGFDVKTNVILIAATNRPDILDPALLRPGRFDRQITVGAPDLDGRHKILEVHARGKPLAPDVDLMAVARRTPGFSGADLANVLNEAALLTARGDAKIITPKFMDEAIDRVIAGPQKSSRLMKDEEKRITAYHEGGHALVAAALHHTDPVHKVTILPRGGALGYTMVLPDEDKYSTTRNEMLDQLAYMMGGRAAEELVFHDPTTGAANDIDKATTLARRMVTQYGMTERLGAIKFGSDSSEPFLGKEMGHQRDYSEEVAGQVDEEVRKLIETAHQEAFDILVENRHILDELVVALLEQETLNKEEIADLFASIEMHERRPAWTGSPTRKPSELGPVDIPVKVSTNGAEADHDEEGIIVAPEGPVTGQSTPSDQSMGS